MVTRRPKARRMPLEVAVFSGQAALQAQLLGAERVELNSPGSYALGGLTPPVDELVRVSARLSIPVHVMIRSRPAPADGRPDFVYGPRDLARMILAICRFKASGVMDPVRGDRFVLGALREVDEQDDDGSDFGIDDDQEHHDDAHDSDADSTRPRKRLVIDETICEALVEVSKPFGCVFHRAFDPIAASSPRRCAHALERLALLGFDALLTAGGPAGSCCDKPNVDTVDHLCHRMAGRLPLIVGGGLRSHNVARAAAQLAVYANGDGDARDSPVWFHTAAVKTIDGFHTEDLDLDELHDLLVQLGHIEPA
ncbi:cutC family protein [Hirsutella rhossiliensis]|uniref:Copper homeostasis protein cutC homolog n=1 Tax=Hirsutella rhossiliensis TaxID=111463 RepID=A0A9P8N129_9HYPO|nr:cutC family domain-containing protein [Hirsutella rhossiliensis]KAH0964967.1 cutC family domain-containing protein [Hirsutella rhossiliensis]